MIRPLMPRVDWNAAPWRAATLALVLGRKPRVPDEIVSRVPEVIAVIRNKGTPRLKAMLDRGELRGLLEARDTAPWANMMALAFATELAQAVLNRSADPDLTRQSLAAECDALRSIPPAHLDTDLIEAWLHQALGEQITFRYKSLADIDVQSFWSLLVICAASCKIARLSQASVVANFDVMVKGLTRQGRHP